MKRKPDNKLKNVSRTPNIGSPPVWQTRIKGIDWSVWSLVLAVVASFILSSRPHWTSSDIPFGDGRWYAQQAVELHGLLHSGQWGKFWDLLCAPTTVTIVPSYLVFLMLPTALATGVMYGVINCASWHILLAYSLYGFSRLAGRRALAVPLFLLVAANNYSLDVSYYYYLDLPFAAVCLMALYLLARAFVEPCKKHYAWAGLSAGLTCFVKPGGSFVFLGLYGIALGVWLVRPLFCHPRQTREAYVRDSWRMLWPWLVTFVPLLVIASLWNLVQRVVQQWVENQGGNYYAEALTVTGLWRLLYFPLCLSYFYSFLVLGTIIVLLLFGFFKQTRQVRVEQSLSPVTGRALILLFVVFVVVWGLIFSWGMTFKPIRSLSLMLPVLWVSAFTITRLRVMRTSMMCIGAALYFAVVHVQFAWEFCQKTNRLAETYHLTGDWLNRLPAGSPNVEAAISITRTLVTSLQQMGVNRGNVAVGSEMLYWNSCSLNWITQLHDLRQGRRPEISFKTAVDNKGNPIRASFETVSALVLPVHPSIQYSREVYRFNVVTAQYAAKHWQSTGRAQMNVLKFGDGQPGVALVSFRQPLTMDEWDVYVRTNFPSGYSEFSAAGEKFGRRLSWRELQQIITQARSTRREGIRHD